MRTALLIAVSAILMAGPSGVALGADCGPLMKIASIGIVHHDYDPRPYIPVSIQGSPRFMLVDTGGGVSEITPEVADELHLQHRAIQFNEVDVAGKSSKEAADVSSFSIGPLTTKAMELVVAPEKGLFGPDNRFAGIVGPNILRLYDVDMDFGASTFSLMSQDHCEGKVVYWPAAAVAVVPFRLTRAWHIAMTVQLDGKSVHAILDTGASHSVIMQPVAESDFDLKMGSPDTPYLGNLGDKAGASMYRHRFKSLDFDGVAVANLDVHIIPDFLKGTYQNGPEIGTRIGNPTENDEFPEMLIGMNVLKHLHVYIAYNEKKLYISPASTPDDRPSEGAGGPGH